MSELESVSESGASSEGSVSPETSSPVESQSTPSTQEVQAAPAQKEPPFNEHPRFKELIAERNQEREERIKYAQEMAVLKSQLEQYNKQTQAQNQPKKPSFDPVFDRLKSIDPEFAELQRTMYERAQKAEQLEQQLTEQVQWRQNYEKQQSAQQAIAQFDKLCADTKISEADKSIYRSTVENMAYARNASAKDLPALFQEAHQQLSKYFENRDREKLQGYVAQKKTDATPATTTGGGAPAARNSQGQYTKDDVKAAIARNIRESGLKI